MKYLTLLFIGLSAFAGKPPSGGSGTPWTKYNYVNGGKRYVAAGDGRQFQLPNLVYAGDSVAGVITNNSGNLSNKTITVSVTLTALNGNPQYTYWGKDTILNQGTTPANYRLFFSSIAAPYTQRPTCGNCYWFSHQAWNYFTNGTTVINGDFNPSQWSNSYGQWATNNLVDFNTAVRSVKQLGLMFGGGNFFDVGIGVVPNSGTAIFTLNNFVVQ